jgi:hypothetical protein
MNEKSAAMLSSRLAWVSSTGAFRPLHLAKCVVARFGDVGTLTKPRYPLSQELNRFDRQRCSKNFFHNDSRLSSQDNERPNLGCVKTHLLHYDIPRNVRQKVISAADAAALVRDNDTVCVSGFLCQGMLTQTEA